MVNTSEIITTGLTAGFDIDVDAARRELGLVPVTFSDEVDRAEFHSPACSLHQLEDSLMNYFNTDELRHELNALLELSYRVARNANSRAIAAGNTSEPMFVQQEEGKWRALLIAYIKSLGGVPCSPPAASNDTQATSIGEAKDGLCILYLECMAQKLRRILPYVRHDRLHSDLRGMLGRYEEQITKP